MTSKILREATDEYFDSVREIDKLKHRIYEFEQDIKHTREMLTEASRLVELKFNDIKIFVHQKEVEMNGMDKAQRSYDRQSPEDNDPPEPDYEDVEKWAWDEGYQLITESWIENRQGMDMVQWQEKNWDKIVEWYIDSLEE